MNSVNRDFHDRDPFGQFQRARISASGDDSFDLDPNAIFILTAALWLGEVPTLIGAIGGVMAIVGVLVVNVMRKR